MSQASQAIRQLDRENYISLATFRRNGDAVRTPVWFAESGGCLYVFTEADSGKGAVKVVISGKLKILSITISPGVIDPDKAGKLEELVLKAVNEAIAKSQKLATKRLKGLTGGLKIPGLT